MTLSQQSENIIQTSALAAAGLGIPGAFFAGIDMVGVVGIWTKMMLDLADDAKHEVDTEFAGKVITSVIAGASLYVGGSKVLTMLLSFTGIGAIPAAGLNALFNWIYTLRLGKMLATQFATPGFTVDMLLTSAKQLTGLFAVPTLGEFSNAWHAVGHLMQGNS